MAKQKKNGFGTFVKILLTLIIAIPIAAAGFLFYRNHELGLQTKAIQAEVDDAVLQYKKEMEQKNLLEERLKMVQNQLDGSEEEKKSLLDEVASLTAQIDDLLTEEVVVVDAAALQEEIFQIGELATVSYHYTNIGTIDASKQWELVGMTIPFTSKTAIVSMDGVLKVGVDVKSIRVECDEATKTIKIKIPAAQILSNELDEDSLIVHEENNGAFNHLKLEDGSTIRSEIKAKAQENADKNNLKEQAESNAKEIIQTLIEAVPGVKETYTIKFQ